MNVTAPHIVRLSLYAAFAACLVGGAAAATMGVPPATIAVPSATAAPDPCAASEIARTIGSVSTNTGNYLDSHPATNTALTSAAQQQPPQALASLKTYFDANPQVVKDLENIQLPLTGLTGVCNLPFSVPQALQLLGAAAQNGGLPDTGALATGATPAGTLPGVTTAGGALPGVTTSGGPLAAEAPAQVPAATATAPGPAAGTAIGPATAPVTATSTATSAGY